jgi:hypothetical protein
MNSKPTREECLRQAAQIIVDGHALQASRTPAEAAKAAWYPGHPMSVAEIEAKIRAHRQAAP